MLDARLFQPGSSSVQPVPASSYTSKIIVMRKKLVPLKDEFSGGFGENEIVFDRIVRGYPASIVSRGTELRFIPQGQTERGDYLLICPFRKVQDGGLLIRERDVVVNMESGLKYLVLWSYDPNNTHIHILAEMRFGILNKDLEGQG